MNFSEELKGLEKTKMEKNEEVVYAINPKDKNHTHYIGTESYREIIELNGTMYHCVFKKKSLLEHNTFFINPAILNHISKDELDEITKSLLEFFATDKRGVLRINKLTDITQTWRGDSPFSVSDYTLMEYKGYIISFHIDLHNGLGITLSSIYRKEDIQYHLKKDFDYEIKLYGDFLG